MCYNWTTKTVKIENINVRSGMKNDISRLIILTKYWAWIMQVIPSIGVCIVSCRLKWVRYPTSTSRHLYVRVAPPPNSQGGEG